MTHSPAHIISKMLVDLGMGADPPAAPWPIFHSAEPPTPDNCITVRDTVGFYSGRAQVTGELMGFFGFQVRVRAVDHVTGWTKADALQTKMAEGTYQETVHVGSSAYLVHAVSKIGDVLPIGTESPTSKRQLFTINAAATIRQL